MKIRELAIFNRLRGKVLLEGLRLLHDALADMPIGGRYWLCHGALLGYAREARLLPHDFDADFNFWREDTDKFLASVPALVAVGFEPKHCFVNLDGETTEYVLTRKSIKYEFFAAHKENNNTRWYIYGEDLRRGLSPSQALCESPGCALDEFEFYGKRWLKPANHEEYLSAVYGDWRTPNTKHDYFRDCACIVEQKVLPGRNLWRGA